MDWKEVFKSFSSKNILVVGDVMIDAYLYGSVNRISPEAPVPILNFEKREERLGGAANVAFNLISLGASVGIASVVGTDDAGKSMRSILLDNKIDDNGLVFSNARKTTVKTRVIGNSQQLIRVDNEQTNAITEKEEASLFKAIQENIDNYDAIIFEDYNKGVLSDSLISKIVELANEKNIITTVDPKINNFLAYQNVTLFKPNLKELKLGLNVDFNFGIERHKFENAVDQLIDIIQPKYLLVTLSEFGVFYKSSDNSHLIPAHKRSISDVSGAGDTVIAVITLALLAGLNIKVAAELANLSGGLVCEEIGVVPINLERLIKEAEAIKL
jgi:rfaE bifunctional protein kinase chain/domain